MGKKNKGKSGKSQESAQTSAAQQSEQQVVETSLNASKSTLMTEEETKDINADPISKDAEQEENGEISTPEKQQVSK